MQGAPSFQREEWILTPGWRNGTAFLYARWNDQLCRYGVWTDLIHWRLTHRNNSVCECVTIALAIKYLFPYVCVAGNKLKGFIILTKRTSLDRIWSKQSIQSPSFPQICKTPRLPRECQHHLHRVRSLLSSSLLPRQHSFLPGFPSTDEGNTWLDSQEDRTACWDCYRNHRACDGLRPCKRCADLGRGLSCRDPAPNERIPRKRKRPNSKGSFTGTKRKGVFFIVDPQIFIFPNTPAVKHETSITPPSSLPSALPVFASNPSLSPTSLPPDRESDREKESSQTNQGEEIQVRYPPSVFSPVLDTQQRFTPVVETEERFTQLLLDLPPSKSYLTPRQATRTREFDIPLSVEDIMEELCVETEEITDLRPTANHREESASVFESLSVPDDMIHLTESVFAPFGLRDSIQVWKPPPL